MHLYLPRSASLARVLALVAVGAGTCAAVPTAQAQVSPALDRVSIGVGGYYAGSDTTVGASVLGGLLHGDVNLEDDLGFDSHGVSPRVRAEFLVGDRQGLSFDYYRYNRDSAETFSRSFTWQDTTYDAYAHIQASMAFDFGSVAWRWWFGEGNDVFGLGVGASYYQVEASVRGNARLNDETREGDASTGTNAWAPLLQIGWRHAFNEHWRLYFDASGVKKNGGKLHGHIFNASLGVEWFPWRNFGLAAEYGVNRIHLQQSHAHYKDHLDLNLNGPSLFLRMRF